MDPLGLDFEDESVAADPDVVPSREGGAGMQSAALYLHPLADLRSAIMKPLPVSTITA
jgi:hypothetical protein